MTLPANPPSPHARLSPRQRRALGVTLAVTVLAAAIGLVLYALSANIVFFYTPTQVAGREAPQGRPFRVGGLVSVGSVVRDGVAVRFTVTDGAHHMNVHYQGSLPDLFREGKGVVAQGKIGADGTFQASEVLAKHDENYMPPEAAAALQQAGHPMQLPSLRTP
jgi:cytochrome c-type biogenesis protein CcmE